MNRSDAGHSEMALTTHRLEALADGIFAIAMTVLVLTIDVPPAAKDANGEALHAILLGQWHQIFNYALSFLLLATFWISHHCQSHFIRRTDPIHLWLNVLILMFVALLPFPASLLGDYPNDWVTGLFFSGTMFILGLLFLINWVYAVMGRRLVDINMSDADIRRGCWRAAVVPAISLVAMGLAVADLDLAYYAFLAIPILLLAPPAGIARRIWRRLEGYGGQVLL